MSELDLAEQTWRITLMKTQIEHNQIDIEKIRQQIDHAAKWEPWKALATILGGIAAGVAAIQVIIHFIR